MEEERERTYGVYFQIPWFAWLVEIDYHFLVREFEFVQRNVGAMGVGTAMVGVEGDPWWFRSHACGSYVSV